MTITIEKKHVYAFIGVLAIAIVAFLLVKSCGKADYEATAKGRSGDGSLIYLKDKMENGSQSASVFSSGF